MNNELIEKWEKECPEFTSETYNDILNWLAIDDKGSIEWENTFVSSKGESRIDEKLAYWSFCWKFGFMGFMMFKKDEEVKAKVATAMFVWLWLKKKVPAGLASDLAEAYAKTFKFE